MSKSTEQSTVAPAPAATLLFQAPDLANAVPAPVQQSAGPENEKHSDKKSKGTKSAKKGDEHASKKKSRSNKKNESAKPDSDAEEAGEQKSSRKTRRRRRSSDSKQSKAEADKSPSKEENEDAEEESSSRRRRRRRRSAGADDSVASTEEVMNEVTALKGSTRLEAKKQRRREGRREGRKRHSITEAEFLARRESVKRDMIVREEDGLNQIAVLEDDLLVEHYVASHTQVSMVGSIFLGRVQNVLPSMEAAFVDLGRGRNAVLYAGEVNWDGLGMAGKPRKIEQALKSGDKIMVQVTKDPIGHKGARLTAQITLAGRYLVMVPGGNMMGISRKLPGSERSRLKSILKDVVPKGNGVIVRTAAEGATEEQIRADIERLASQWQSVQDKSAKATKAPMLLKGEPELALRVVRDIFNEDFNSLVVQGKDAYKSIHDYVKELSPDLLDRVHQWAKNDDIFAAHRIDEQLAKGMDRKVWLPSGGYLIIDRTEAMTVIDVNTGKYTGGKQGTLEETVTKNNLESAEEIVRQLRLRDIGGIIVIDFVDMVLESNRSLVLRRLIECLGRDRTRHQVTEVTALGLAQMTRKRVGQGLVEAFSTPCECCDGRGFIVHQHPVERGETNAAANKKDKKAAQRRKEAAKQGASSERVHEADQKTRDTLAAIAKAAEKSHEGPTESEARIQRGQAEQNSAEATENRPPKEKQPKEGHSKSNRKEKRNTPHLELPEVKSANKRKRAAKMDISDIQLPDPKSGAEGESKEETPKRRHRRRAATSASVKTDSSSSTSGVMIR
ncbi:Rne/Rng family ribonuclease [Winkia sp. UMB6473-AN360BR]|uniref:Rne/Rng family ribonuclease n=1 Tax=Winkia sp. UMB6473-AN360BR TaxID=3050611 RepID=UPI0025570705|nr:Rne/Rng family ribonuclease [Winkia sp. UMB6473-AN360BR]MDK8816063.1 Rne/Rng family ribonuclease [Winkia sp. UMB6473-AN360BR]